MTAFHGDKHGTEASVTSQMCYPPCRDEDVSVERHRPHDVVVALEFSHSKTSLLEPPVVQQPLLGGCLQGCCGHGRDHQGAQAGWGRLRTLICFFYK